MAKYTKTFTSDGLEQYELEFRGESFSYKMVPTESGKMGDKSTFGHQVAEVHEDISDETLIALDEVCFASDDEVCELLEVIAEDE